MYIVAVHRALLGFGVPGALGLNFREAPCFLADSDVSSTPFPRGRDLITFLGGTSLTGVLWGYSLRTSFNLVRAGARAVDLDGQAFIRGDQNLKLSTKADVFKIESLLIGGAKHVDWGARPLLAPP